MGTARPVPLISHAAAWPLLYFTYIKAVVRVNNSHEGMLNNIKFRSFVCCGLNHGLLHVWVLLLLSSNNPALTKFYESWAFVNSGANAQTYLAEALLPLGHQLYRLTLDFELRYS